MAYLIFFKEHELRGELRGLGKGRMNVIKHTVYMYETFEELKNAHLRYAISSLRI